MICFVALVKALFVFRLAVLFWRMSCYFLCCCDEGLARFEVCCVVVAEVPVVLVDLLCGSFVFQFCFAMLLWLWSCSFCGLLCCLGGYLARFVSCRAAVVMVLFLLKFVVLLR